MCYLTNLFCPLTTAHVHIPQELQEKTANNVHNSAHATVFRVRGSLSASNIGDGAM